jgi:cytochrome c1
VALQFYNTADKKEGDTSIYTDATATPAKYCIRTPG